MFELLVFPLLFLKSTIDAHPAELVAQRTNISLVCAFVAALTLSLATMHPEQPVSFLMDMVSFGFHTGEVPALASIQFEEAARQDVLLVPLHSRLAMGMVGLWIAMIFAALLLVVPLLRNIGTQSWVKYGVWLPPSLVLITLSLWIVSVQGTFSQAEFANYLTEFDLASIASITYPEEAWSLSSPWFVAVRVGCILILSFNLLSVRLDRNSASEEPKSLSAMLGEKVSLKSLGERFSLAHPSFRQGAFLGVFITTIWRVGFADSATAADQWASLMCLGFSLISLIEQRGGLKVWSAICCVLVALAGVR